MASIYTLVTLMRNPYTINPQDISPEMVTSLLEGRIAEAARIPKVLPVQRSNDNIASIIANLDLNTPAGRQKKAELLQRKKAQVADKKDALAGKTHGTVSRPDGTTKLGSKDVKIASDEDARGAQNPEDLENSHNTYDSDDNSIRLELKLRTTKKKFAGGKLGKKSQEFPTGGEMTGKEKKGLRKLAGKNKKVATHGDLSNLVSAHDDVQEENKAWDAVKRTGSAIKRTGRAVKDAWENDRDPNNTDNAVMAGTFGGAAATALGGAGAGLATGTAITSAGLTKHLTQTYKGAKARLAGKPAEGEQVAAPVEPVEEGGTVAPNLQKVATMTMTKAQRKKMEADRLAYNNSKVTPVTTESFKQWAYDSENTHKGLKRRTVTGA